jgi:hypothetical protein
MKKAGSYMNKSFLSSAVYSWLVIASLFTFFVSSAEAGLIYRTTQSGTPGVVFELTFLDSVASGSNAWLLPDANLSDVLEGGISGFRADFNDGNGWLTALSGDLPKSSVGAMFSNDGTSIDGGQFYPGSFIGGVTFSNGFVIGTPTLAHDHSWYMDASGSGNRLAGAYAYELFGSVSVPEPGTLWLLGSGIIGLISVARARNNK